MSQNRANIEIRIYAFQKSIPLWRIADEMGISSGYLSKKMRRELSTEEKAKIKNIIDVLSISGEVVK